MSFVPNPTQTNASNGPSNAPSSVVTTATAVAAAPELSDLDLLYKLRTFDVYWVEKNALMYRDGIAKVRENRKYPFTFVVLWSCDRKCSVVDYTIRCSGDEYMFDL
jgi:hypothetical protein